MAANKSETYTANGVVKFHNEMSNISPSGSGWNPDNNKFRCPYDGYYQFVVTLYKADVGAGNFNYYAELLVSGRDILRLYNNRANDVGGVYYSSTMSAIAPCQTGQEVWVRIRPIGGASTVYLASHNTHFQQFSGQLIKLQGQD